MKNPFFFSKWDNSLHEFFKIPLKTNTFFNIFAIHPKWLPKLPWFIKMCKKAPKWLSNGAKSCSNHPPVAAWGRPSTPLSPLGPDHSPQEFQDAPNFVKKIRSKLIKKRFIKNVKNSLHEISKSAIKTNAFLTFLLFIWPQKRAPSDPPSGYVWPPLDACRGWMDRPGGHFYEFWGRLLRPKWS